jgi:integrase
MARSVVEEYEQEYRAIHYQALRGRPASISERLSVGEDPRIVKALLTVSENWQFLNPLSTLDLNSAKSDVADWLEEKGYTVDDSTLQELAILRNALWKKRVDANQLLLDNKLSEYEQAVDYFRDEAASDAITFQELYDKFLQYKINHPVSPINDRIQKEYTRFMEYIAHVCSDFLASPVDKIQRKAVRSVIMDYLRLPKRNKSPYKQMEWPELVAYVDENDIPAEDLQSHGSADNLRKFLQGVFKYAVDEEILAGSPAQDLKLELALEGNRGYYRIEEARLMEQGFSCLPNEERKWVGLLALYHGARAGELTQLRKQDIRVDPASDRHYMVVSESAGSIKTKSGNRSVPLHKKLIEMGFIDFVEQCQSERLFPNCYGQKMTSWLYGVQEAVGVSKYDEHGLKRDFHSFRHTVVTMLRRAQLNESAIQQVVGHKVTSQGITDRYTHGFEVKDLVGVVDALSYDD